MADGTPAWQRSVIGEFSIQFANPPGATKPRKVTGQHIRELNARLEATARTYFETVDQKKPYAVGEARFRTRYGYFAVDTDADPAADADPES